MATLFDQYSNIDAWYIRTNTGIRGLASRVQYDCTFNTFTVRKERETGARTEFEKLSYAIKHGWIYPYWFCHAYLYPAKPEKKLYSVAICKTSDLIKYIQQGQKDKDWTIRSTYDYGAADFYAIDWEIYEEKGFFIKKWVRHSNLTILSYIEKSKEL